MRKLFWHATIFELQWDLVEKYDKVSIRFQVKALKQCFIKPFLNPNDRWEQGGLNSKEGYSVSVKGLGNLMSYEEIESAQESGK